MTLRFSGCAVLVGFLAAVASACDGSAQEGATFGGGPVRNDPTGSAPRADGGPKPGASTDARVVTFEVRPNRPPPTVSSEVKLLVPGRAQLIGGGLSSCSNQPQPAGTTSDRWCGFTLPGTRLGDTELWVINVTKAMKSEVACDGNDPNCRRLTGKLWTGTPDFGTIHPYSHKFDGDTLIYYADTPSSNDIYKGPIYAWRPGWAQGRVIVTRMQKGFRCTGHARTAVAVCIANLTDDTAMTLQFDLLAGPISDADKPLPFVARITPSRANQGGQQWGSAFSRDGEWFAYSTGGKTTAEVESLFAVKTVDTADRSQYIEVGSRISRWQMSLDGKRWYYLRNFNYNRDGAPSGTLTVADFPGGVDNETTLASKVGAYVLMNDGSETDRGIGIFTNVMGGQGKLAIIKDWKKPDEVQDVVSGINGAFMSRDLRYTLYSKNCDPDTGQCDLWIAKNDGTGSCNLVRDSTTDQFGSPFLDNAGMVFWADKIDPSLGVGEGWRANPDGCGQKTRFAPNGVDFWHPVRNEGLIYTDEGDGEVATLKVAPIANNVFPSMPTVVQRQIGRIFSLLLPAYDVGVFTLRAEIKHIDGLYGVGLPFSTAPRPDAGVDRVIAEPGAPETSGSDVRADVATTD